MNTYKITKSWNNLKEFYNSEEMINLYEGFTGRNNALRNNEEWDLTGEIVFIKGALVNGNLYKFYKTDGIQRMQKVTIDSALTNQPVSMCKIDKENVHYLDSQDYGCHSKEAMKNNSNKFFYGTI